MLDLTTANPAPELLCNVLNSLSNTLVSSGVVCWRLGEEWWLTGNWVTPGSHRLQALCTVRGDACLSFTTLRVRQARRVCALGARISTQRQSGPRGCVCVVLGLIPAGLALSPEFTVGHSSPAARALLCCLPEVGGGSWRWPLGLRFGLQVPAWAGSRALSSTVFPWARPGTGFQAPGLDFIPFSYHKWET